MAANKPNNLCSSTAEIFPQSLANFNLAHLYTLKLLTFSLQVAAMGTQAASPSEEQETLPIADQQELTDDQIKILLKRAEERLRTKATEPNPTQFDISDFKLPQLNCTIPQAPVQISNSVARADVSSLLPNDIRQSGSKIRKVEDPVLVKKRLAEVYRT